jgi:hypothetical protein
MRLPPVERIDLGTTRTARAIYVALHEKSRASAPQIDELRRFLCAAGELRLTGSSASGASADAKSGDDRWQTAA